MIKAVLSDDLLELPSSRKFSALKITNKKLTNKIIQDFNTKLPLDCISYIRRVHKDEILVCPQDNIKNLELREFLSSKSISDEIIDSLKESRIVTIYDTAPKLRWQQDQMNRDWPSKFHKNDYLESLYNNTIFTLVELKSHCKYMEVCQYLSSKLQNDNVAIAVNPYISNRIVAFGFSKTPINPIIHCAIDLIDQVAITQNGGVWSTEHNEEYMKLSKEVSERFSVEFGEGNYEKSSISDDNLQKFGPYLCTGYLIYLLNEPCLMCSMALTHARSKIIFYHRASSNGGLCTTTKLHTNKNLNHRYEVFHILSLSLPQNAS